MPPKLKLCPPPNCGRPTTNKTKCRPIVLSLNPYTHTRSGGLYIGLIESLPNAMPIVTRPFSLFSPPVKNHLKYALHPLPSVALAGLMISELSACCECRLFGTGLVMSENASDCTQNAAYRNRKLKKNSGKGAQPLPQTSPFWSSAPTAPRFSRSTCCPSTFIICPPPYTHTSGYGPASCVCRRHPDLRLLSAVSWA